MTDDKPLETVGVRIAAQKLEDLKTSVDQIQKMIDAFTIGLKKWNNDEREPALTSFRLTMSDHDKGVKFELDLMRDPIMELLGNELATRQRALDEGKLLFAKKVAAEWGTPLPPLQPVAAEEPLFRRKLAMD